MKPASSSQRTLEIILVLIAIALSCLLHKTTGYKIIVLNLFYLPVILAAFFLGRYRAGILAFFCVIAASIVTAIDLGDFASFTSPLVIGLSVVVWGAVLGLTALLVGTLSDELESRLVELHEAHVGVVEVLSRYLQSADPRLNDRSRRIAELCQEVAVQMKLSSKEVDDVRVAALLHDMENIEITARVIKKAMGDLEDEKKAPGHHTFHGADLVHSLGPVLRGAFPILLNQRGDDHHHPGQGWATTGDEPFGAKIIRTVRAYDSLMYGEWKLPDTSPANALHELRRDTQAEHHPAVLHALERVVTHTDFAERSLSCRVELEDTKIVGAR